MKQTAVEWLGFNLNMLFSNVTEEEWNKADNLFKQAKEMEKQQIIDAVDGHPLFARPFEGTDYYDEVYKK